MKSKLKKLFDLLYVNYVRAFKKTELYQPSYNSQGHFLFRSSQDQRSSDDRLDLITTNLPQSPGSYLDVGSQLGYFVLKISEKGFLSTGIEVNPVSYNYSSSLMRLNDVKNVSFLNFSLDIDSASSLPDFDVISILSVYHHMVYFAGKEKADTALRILISKCKKTFFFETGEFEEKDFYWTDGLSFMGPNSSEGIENFLMSFGFTSVKKIGENPTHLTSHKRSLFKCEK
jgi:hypothetical protein